MNTLKLATITSVMALAASAASASTYTINSMSVNPTPYETLNVDGPLFSDHPIAGLMTVGTTSGKSFKTFCADISGVIYIGSDNLTYMTSTTLPNDGFGTTVPTLTQREIQALANRGFAGGTGDQLAALQGAIWGLEYPSETIGSSNPVVEALIISDEAWAVSNPANLTSFLVKVGDNGQNLVVGTLSVPEPATWVMMLVGFGLLSVRTSNKMRRTI